MKKAFRLAVAAGVAAAGLALTLPSAVAGATAASTVARPPARAASPAVSGRLYAVTAISDRDVWAAGLTPDSPLLLHWNGSGWSEYVSGPGYYIGVADSSARDVWAVGGTNWFSPTQTLAVHWNGSSWTQVRTPSPAGGGYFNAVAATSPRNAWAVGLAGPGPGVPSPTTPLIEHWNGKTWTIQGFQASPAGGEFAGVAATSASNAWAAGWTGPASEGTGQQTLIEHWNGKTWRRVPSPNPPGSTGSFLKGVAVISATSAWAVGNSVIGGQCKTLVLYWNGRHWTIVPSPTPGGDAAFMGVAASWTRNIWAVGITNPTRCGHGPACQTLIEHWNSTRWKVIPSPNPPSDYLNVLFSASAIARDDIWAVGSTDYASVLVVHWNGHSWS